jgi:vacuolar-type H+-ATPase subunit D/Vma8
MSADDFTRQQLAKTQTMLKAANAEIRKLEEEKAFIVKQFMELAQKSQALVNESVWMRSLIPEDVFQAALTKKREEVAAAQAAADVAGASTAILTPPGGKN